MTTIQEKLLNHFFYLEMVLSRIQQVNNVSIAAMIRHPWHYNLEIAKEADFLVDVKKRIILDINKEKLIKVVYIRN